MNSRNRNFRVLRIKSLFANIWICETADEIWQMHWKHTRTFPTNLIREMINTQHRDLVKYHDNITSRIILMFRVDHEVFKDRLDKLLWWMDRQMVRWWKSDRFILLLVCIRQHEKEEYQIQMLSQERGDLVEMTSWTYT